MAGRRSTPDRVVIGLDVGTTSAKAVAFEPGTTWRRSASREYPLLEPTAGEQVQDPAIVLGAARTALAECVEATGQAKVAAVSVSAGMHGLIALDADRRPLTNLVTWADGRAAGVARRWHQEGRARALHATTGVPVHPMSPLTKLRWFADNDAATWNAARWWVGLKEHLLLWLTGQLVTELSSASGTGLLDMATRTWSPDALAACGVDAGRLAPILPTTATLPLAASAAREVGLPVGTPVVVGAADGPLANLGTGAIEPGVAALSLGTSGAVRMAVRAPHVDEGGHLFCYALTDEVWVIGGAISNGASVMRWVGEALVPDLTTVPDHRAADAAVLELAATVPPGSDGLVMLPYLLPERAPLWNPDLPGAYVGLRRGHTRAHLARAALEGVSMNLRLIVDALDAVEPVRSVRATGGAFEAPLWRDVVAAVVNRPMTIADAVEGTAAGAAALALVAIGEAATLTDAVATLTVQQEGADTGAAGRGAVHVDPRLAADYDRIRRAVVLLIRQLDVAASVYAGSAHASTEPPERA